jgi:ketosteroid isomerase-like protein
MPKSNTGHCIGKDGDVAGRPELTIERIRDAITRHDLDALTGCFAEDYINETPIHPSRGFRGRDQVRRNWQRIFEAAPDIGATVIRRASDGATVWSEWELRGHRSDGSSLTMRGVGIFGIADDQAQWCRFYLDPVDEASTDIDRATEVLLQGSEGMGRA